MRSPLPSPQELIQTYPQALATPHHDCPLLSPFPSLQCTELRSANEKLGREVRSLGSELAALKEDGGGDGGGAAGRRVSLMSLAAMEKIQVGGGRGGERVFPH